jgi:hypothetical protein
MFAAQMEFSFDKTAGNWNFPCSESYCTTQLINKFKRMQVCNVHCKYPYYAYYNKNLKCSSVVKWCKTFLIKAGEGMSICVKN